MKMLKTFLKTSPSNIELNFPDPFQAMMIIALIEGNMPKKNHLFNISSEKKSLKIFII